MKNFWKLKSSNYIFALFFLLLTTAATSPIEFEKYKGYYVFPISPGQRSYLSGNFCELRGSHFHAGVDIKIGGVVGSPIHAAADGYVSRIKVSAGGYGNALYIQHPNGTTSVYAHLLEYNDKIATYVREAQYAKKSFEIELFPGSGTLTVKQGEVIGKAGNSGSSGGPHLHFEIRDRNQFPLDPLKFGFSEVVDTTPPDVRKIALTTLDKDARVNGQFGRFEFDLVAQGRSYVVREPIEVHGQVGVEISAFDRADGVRNLNGVSATDMSFDEKTYFHQEMNRFSFSEGRNIFVHTNYEIKQKNNRTFYKLYVDDGNTLDFYETNETSGKIKITDTEEHALLINVYDSYGNKSEVNATLVGKTPEDHVKVRYFNKPDRNKNYYISHNILQLFVPVDETTEVPVRKILNFYANRRSYEQSPDYLVNDVAVYLWDLRKGVPDSVNVCDGIEYLGISMAADAGNAYDFYQPAMNIHISKNALFDTAYLYTGYDQSDDQEIFTLHENTIPLRSYLTVALKPLNTYAEKVKTSVYAITDDDEYEYMGGDWHGEQISFRTRDFGKYTLKTDNDPPAIRPASISANSLRFTIKDELSGIKDFSAYVDGKWVLMHYDYKKDLIWSEKLDESQSFAGELKLVVTDNVGNQEVYTTSIGG